MQCLVNYTCWAALLLHSHMPHITTFVPTHSDQQAQCDLDTYACLALPCAALRCATCRYTTPLCRSHNDSTMMGGAVCRVYHVVCRHARRKSVLMLAVLLAVPHYTTSQPSFRADTWIMLQGVG